MFSHGIWFEKQFKINLVKFSLNSQIFFLNSCKSFVKQLQITDFHLFKKLQKQNNSFTKYSLGCWIALHQ